MEYSNLRNANDDERLAQENYVINRIETPHDIEASDTSYDPNKSDHSYSEEDIEQRTSVDFEEYETATSEPVFSRLSNNGRDGVSSASSRRRDIIDDIEDEEQDYPVDETSAIMRTISVFEIPKLGGMTEQIFNIDIYPFLNPKDLCYLGACSKFFLRSTSTSKVWIRLTQRHFLDFKITVPRYRYQSDVYSQHMSHIRGVYDALTLHDNDETASRESRNNLSISSGSNTGSARVSTADRSNYSSAVSASAVSASHISSRTVSQRDPSQSLLPVSSLNYTSSQSGSVTNINSPTTLNNTGTGPSSSLNLSISTRFATPLVLGTNQSDTRSASNSSTPVARHNSHTYRGTSTTLTNNVLASLRERGERNPTNNSLQESESNAPIEFNDGVNNIYNKFAAKSLYIKKYLEMKRLSNQRHSYDSTYLQNYLTENKTIFGEKILDFFLVRFLMIIPFLSSFLTLLLFGLYFDNVLNTSVWICAIPFLFLFIYFMCCVALLKYVKVNQFIPKSYFYGLWTTLRSPLKVLFMDSHQPLVGTERRCRYLLFCFNYSNPGVIICITAFFLILLQFILITFKIGTLSTYVSPLDEVIPWGAIFSPSWCLFVLYCLTSHIVQENVYINGLVFIWIPFFILLLCLTLKLDGIADIRMVYIFIPFWVIEGFILFFSFTFLIVGYKRRSLGFQDTVDENWAGCWFLTWPLVIFQILLCLYDDVATVSTKLTHTEILSPLLFLIGWGLLSSIGMSYYMTTSYELARPQKLSMFTGVYDIYKV